MKSAKILNTVHDDHAGVSVAVIGGGVSGLTSARRLADLGISSTVYEKNQNLGGMIRCEDTSAGLYHKVGGHVFNTKTPDVLNWFWTIFNPTDFNKLSRNAKILFEGSYVGYPIENNLHELAPNLRDQVVEEIIALSSKAAAQDPATTLGSFFRSTFGQTLNTIYFTPYNQKLWGGDIDTIPLDWLEGKLPMPTPEQIIIANVSRAQETAMVHSSFFYPKRNGSQFIADTLAAGLDLKKDVNIEKIHYDGKFWSVNGDNFSHLIYTGDIRKLEELLTPEAIIYTGIQVDDLNLSTLKTRGISNVFCRCDPTDISWLYIPDPNISCNRIIYTGSFSKDNTANSERSTCVVEFPFGVSDEEMDRCILQLPGNLERIARTDTENAYIIPSPTATPKINRIKESLERSNMYLVGRFAEWQYYNMDKAMEAALAAATKINSGLQNS